MKLSDLIAALSRLKPETVVPYTLVGCHSFHPNRYHDTLWVEVGKNPSEVSSWLSTLEGLVGKTIEGHKGGQYTITEDVIVDVEFECDYDLEDILWQTLNGS